MGSKIKRMDNKDYEKLADKLHGHIRGNKGEYIICAAIWYKDIAVDRPDRTANNIDRGIVICGHRHGHCIAVLNQCALLRSVSSGPNSVGDFIQGFLTSKGNFVDRKEAGKIAYERGQITKETDCLFSEDLY